MGGISKVIQSIHFLQTAINNYKQYGPPGIPNISAKTFEYARDTFADEYEILDYNFDPFAEISEDEDFHQAD